MVIEYEIDLSLTESLIPTTVHVKQFDHMARKIRCRLYKDALAYPIPETAVLTYFGTRPDGRTFQYGSDTTPELVFYDEGAVVITITDYMTEVYGRFPVDISLIAESGDVLSSFSMVLKVEASAVRNKSLASLTYAGCLQTTIENISACFITEDGYFGVYSDNGLDLKAGSYSGTVAKVAEVIEDGLMETMINDDGVCVYETGRHFALKRSECPAMTRLRSWRSTYLPPAPRRRAVLPRRERNGVSTSCRSKAFFTLATDCSAMRKWLAN